MRADTGTDQRMLTADEVGNLLRTSRSAIYAMVERGHIPGIVRIGRRLLFRRDDLLDWRHQKSAPSLKE
jgi:excisionase family DNA binding protein